MAAAVRHVGDDRGWTMHWTPPTASSTAARRAPSPAEVARATTLRVGRLTTRNLKRLTDEGRDVDKTPLPPR